MWSHLGLMHSAVSVNSFRLIPTSGVQLSFEFLSAGGLDSVCCCTAVKPGIITSYTTIKPEQRDWGVRHFLYYLWSQQRFICLCLSLPIGKAREPCLWLFVHFCVHLALFCCCSLHSSLHWLRVPTVWHSSILTLLNFPYIKGERKKWKKMSWISNFHVSHF